MCSKKSKHFSEQKKSSYKVEQHLNSGAHVKKEFAACSVGMDLPPGHELRDSLAAKKKKLEDLLDKLLGICSTTISNLNSVF